MPFFFFRFLFNVAPFKKFIDSVTILLLLCVLVLWSKIMWDIRSLARNQTHSPGKSPSQIKVIKSLWSFKGYYPCIATLCIELLMGKLIEISSFLEQRIGAPRVASHQQSEYVKTEENISTGLFGKLLDRVASSFKMPHARTAALSAPNPAAAHRWPTPPPETPGHS